MTDDFTTIVDVLAPRAPLALDGFTPGAPAAVQPETLALDTMACAEAAYPHCGRTGLTFVPYHKGDRYRARATCDGCGE
jgi:hypothetical protein